MKILIKGYYGFGNFGDDILMITAFKLLRAIAPDATLFVFSNFNENLRGFDRDAKYNYYIHSLLDESPPLVDWTYQGSFDLVVDGGGGVYFDDRRGSWLSEVRNVVLRALGFRNVLLVDMLLRTILSRPKRLRYTRRMGLGLGIGPYAFGARLLYAHLADIATFDVLMIRDAASLSFLTSYKFSGQRFLGTDLTFYNKWWLSHELSFSKEKPFGGRIAIVLMDSQHDNTVVFRRFRNFIDELVVKGYKVTLFSFDENNDRQFIGYFRDFIPFVIWRPNNDGLKSFLSHLHQQDLVITSRAHGAIIGAQLGVVPVCLGKTPKLREVAKMFPGSGLVVDFPIDFMRLHQLVAQIESDYPVFMERLVADVSVNKVKIEETVCDLRNFI